VKIDINAPLWKKLLPAKILELVQKKMSEDNGYIASLPIELISHLPLQSAVLEKGLILQLYSPPQPQNLDQETQAYINAGDWLHIAAYLIKFQNAYVGSISCRISEDYLLIAGVDVKESCRGRGIMKLLMAQVLAIAARLNLSVRITDVSHSYPSFLDNLKEENQDLAIQDKINNLINKFNEKFRNPYDTLGFFPVGAEERTAVVSQEGLKTMFKGFLRRNSIMTVSHEEASKNKPSRNRRNSY
jgi:GNAT superfamily N-acetyltransferase